MLEIERVREVVASGKIAPVYLWHGEDKYLLREAVQVLKSYYLSLDPSGSGIETLPGKDAPLSQVIEYANTVSFFAKRLLIIEDIPYFQDNSGIDLAPLYEYLENPNPDTCLLLLAENVHRGRKLYKLMEQHGVILEFAVPNSPQDWMMWLKDAVSMRGKKMNSENMQFLLEWAGHNSGILSRELDKVAAYAGERKEIGKEDIRAVVNRTVEATVFELVDAIAVRSVRDALTKLHEVLKEEHYLKVQTMIVRQVRLLLAARSWRERGGKLSDFGGAVGVKSPYAARKIWQQSEKLSFKALAAGMANCLETEIALKSGGGDPVFLLELLIVNLCTSK
ncbi:DNA polymerase III subunit delta [Paradesulfitobacterium ferrireducens]|uniref:DNA polymerase III subunit delta n=1 Tax=Paradesulfitobacterium ferrireducens TaxID=2816476 RepID=UPI001A8F4E63|nr:DNA polymerase III subunit delta [Paradesulfitobacterium ferrireducens]